MIFLLTILNFLSQKELGVILLNPDKIYFCCDKNCIVREREKKENRSVLEIDLQGKNIGKPIALLRWGWFSLFSILIDNFHQFRPNLLSIYHSRLGFNRVSSMKYLYSSKTKWIPLIIVCVFC